MTTRYEELISVYSGLFETEREEKLPVWAQIKLNQLRKLLEGEAHENDMLREEISRLLTKP